MAYHSPLIHLFILSVLLLVSSVSSDNQHEHDPTLFHFVTRPDLKAPKWEIKIHEEDRLSDGYWFIAAKPSQEETIGTDHNWWGPAIYHGKTGELVWSGADQLDSPNVMDFRLSQVNGEPMLTMLDRDREAGVLLDTNYEVVDMVNTRQIDFPTNGHEFNFVKDARNGSSVLILLNHKRDATEEDKEGVGFTGSGDCTANYLEFRELNSSSGNWGELFAWDSRGHIHLNESTDDRGDINDKCGGDGWDFMHANSIDKCPDGDFVFSARHCDTIYKISHIDGSIQWRLNGKQPDFDMGNVNFSRQHDIRCMGQNETHTLVSMLDNAVGQDAQDPTHDFSRGILVALDMRNMSASFAATYDHPYKDEEEDRVRYAPRRGNMQTLEDGNVFMGWSERALQSEYAADGTILMEAVLQADWIGSYRNYKFPYVGRPLTRPDVHAAASFEDGQHERLFRTHVYVSWNGDTEVATWNMYGGSSPDNDDMEQIDSRARTGFETYFEYTDYAKYVRLEGVDKRGETVGDSGTIKTILHPTQPPPVEDYEDETDNNLNAPRPPRRIMGMPTAAFIVLFALGCIGGTSILLLAWFGTLPLPWATQAREFVLKQWKLRKERGDYKQVAGQDQDEEALKSLTLPRSPIRMPRDPDDTLEDDFR